MTVSDLAAEEAFLSQLGLVQTRSGTTDGDGAFASLVGLPGARARTAALTLGTNLLELTAFAAPLGRAMPEPSRSNDGWFQHIAIVVADIDRAHDRLAGSGMRPVSPAPQTIPPDNAVAAGVRAYYFRDPEGHSLELLWFPEGKGDPRWHAPTNALFLGIDHTGITSSDTARSLSFYRDLIGLEVASESMNAGIEQEALSGVPGARVHITSLRGKAGAGIELLEYLAPRDGRPFPASTAADRVHWETTIAVPDIDDTARRLTAAGVRFWSDGERGVVDVSSWHGKYRRAALVNDPDGHAVRIVAE